MTITRQDIEDGASWVRRTLRKPEPTGAVKTPEQRRAAWLKEQAGERQPERPAAERISPEVSATRSQLHRPGTEFAVGADRFAADGTRWRRVG
jgi:hypothetical protein